MLSAATVGERKTVLFAAHKLKGSAANVRAPELSAHAGGLEKHLMDDGVSIDLAEIRAVAAAYSRFRGEVLLIYPEIAGAIPDRSDPTSMTGGV